MELEQELEEVRTAWGQTVGIFELSMRYWVGKLEEGVPCLRCDEFMFCL